MGGHRKFNKRPEKTSRKNIPFKILQMRTTAVPQKKSGAQ